MPRRFWALLVKDLRLLWRNYFVIVVLILVLFYAAAVRFIVPVDLSPDISVVMLDTTGSQALRLLYERAGGGRVIAVGSEEDYLAALDNGNRIGLRIEGQVGPERIEVTYQGWEAARTRRLFEAMLQSQVAALSGQVGLSFPIFTRQVLREGEVAVKQPSFSLALLPILIFSEAVLMGLFLDGALVLGEREEQVQRAYQCTPAGAVEYLLARGAAMGLLGLLFTVLLTPLTVGFSGNWHLIMPLVFLGAVLVSFITQTYASLFRNLSEYMAGSLLAILILTAPAASYFQPTFAPAVIRLLPSYALIFALREAYFPSGNPQIVWAALRQIGLTAVLVFPIALAVVRRGLRGGEA